MSMEGIIAPAICPAGTVRFIIFSQLEFPYSINQVDKKIYDGPIASAYLRSVSCCIYSRNWQFDSSRFQHFSVFYPPLQSSPQKNREISRFLVGACTSCG